MDTPQANMARQIGEAAIAYEQWQTGRAPKSVTVVMGEQTLVITMQGALSPAEVALAQSPQGAAQVQEFHRQLFISSSESLLKEIKRITGVEVCAAAGETELDGTTLKIFTTGTLVHVFLLARSVPAECWSGSVA